MRRPSTIRRVAAPSLAALALVAVTACGAQNDNDPDADAADAVPADARAVALADDDADALQKGEKVDPEIFIADLRAALAEAETGHLVVSMDLFGSPLKVTGDVDFRGDTPAVAGVVSGGMAGEGTEVRLVDGVLYAKVPGLSDGKFLKLDLGDFGGFGAEFGKLDSLADPLSAFEEYDDVISSVTLVGTDTLDGEATERYRVRLDPSKLKDLKADDRLSAHHGLPKNVSFDLWVGKDDNLVRKLVVDLPHTGEMSLRASDWGDDVHIVAPKPSEVTDFDLGELGGLGGLGDMGELGAAHDS
jgi:hypothetical protein